MTARSSPLATIDPGGATTTDRVTVLVEPTDAPTAQILLPISEGTYYSDLLIELEGVVQDAEDGPGDLTGVWSTSLGDDLSLLDTQPDSTGTLTGSTYLQEGQHQLKLTATDATGKTGTDTVVLTVGPPNSAPACGFTAPEDGGASEQGALVIFEGTATDADISNDLLTVEFRSDKDKLFGTATPTTEGVIRLPYSDLSVNTHVITMTVSDELGATCTADLVYTVGTPPTVTILEPEPDALSALYNSVTFEALVEDSEDSPSDVSLSWVSSLDGEINADSSDSAGLASFSTTTLTPGFHTVTVTATDTAGLFATDRLDVQVNTPPTAPVIHIEPTSPSPPHTGIDSSSDRHRLAITPSHAL